jgi:2-phospho-L-lactate guanylyltransferase (CobY/MobA/RfbA family)
VFAPLYVGILPVPGTAAAARLDACKQRLRDVAAHRPRAAFLDLMIENSVTQTAENYFDDLHLVTAAVPQFEAAISRVLAEDGLRPE